WGASVAAIQGLVAKENVVSTIEVILGLSNQTITDLFTPLNAFTFMTFNLFSAPCFGAIGAMRDAFGSRKKMWYAVLLQTGFAWIISSLIFGIVTLIGVIF
ncbi:MAG: ferrous iron transport protein B, partial [Acholeplasmataceae bacterium]|nr:ferrous iron transport protein B [Acholeplasmataceae bacterium]